MHGQDIFNLPKNIEQLSEIDMDKLAAEILKKYLSLEQARQSATEIPDL
jgi:hypothetical protein